MESPVVLSMFTPARLFITEIVGTCWFKESNSFLKTTKAQLQSFTEFNMLFFDENGAILGCDVHGYFGM